MTRNGIVALLVGVTVVAGCRRTTAPRPDSFVAVRVLPPGPKEFGRNNYVEYVPGTLPIIITAPHGGRLKPTEIPDRVAGTLVTDTNTDSLAYAVSDAFLGLTNKRPHVIITHLDRDKIDNNRDSAEATAGQPHAITAWQEWHAFIGKARTAVLASSTRGLYIDLHGHGHAIARLELGYQLTSSDLGLSDTQLDANTVHERKSSLRTFSEDSPLTFSAFVRGPSSLGALLGAEAFPSIPSPLHASPGTAPYFDGGYNTDRYGCADGGPICAVQIEANFAGVRDNAVNREKFAKALAKVVEQFLREQVNVRIKP
jgi:N-formylglutamate amidohydrolase